MAEKPDIAAAIATARDALEQAGLDVADPLKNVFEPRPDPPLDHLPIDAAAVEEWKRRCTSRRAFRHVDGAVAGVLALALESADQVTVNRAVIIARRAFGPHYDTPA